MYLEKFLTEYDEGVSSELNLDPLGLQVIWSAYGQKIFKNRISSISNDVRNYTLNLFHHYIVRTLIDDDGVDTVRPLARRYPKKEKLDFKQALLVHLENVFVYSVIANEREPGAVDAAGVLGIMKARRRWEEEGHNPTLLFSHAQDGQVLVRQTILGVSGRYKTPLAEVGFFDRRYSYHIPASEPLWNQAADFVASTPALRELEREVLLYLKDFFAEGARKIDFSEVPEQLQNAYVKAFKSPADVGAYSRDFWLGITDLNLGAAGALLSVLDGAKVDYSPREVFGLAKAQLDGSGEETIKVENIEVLEPFLADLDLLLSLAISKKALHRDEVLKAWKHYGRDEKTLTVRAADISANAAVMGVLTGLGAQRLRRLLKLTDVESLADQLDFVASYHRRIMESRGQSPWFVIDADGGIRTQIKARPAPDPKEKPVGGWLNHYYIPQFRNLVEGFQGVPA